MEQYVTPKWIFDCIKDAAEDMDDGTYVKWVDRDGRLAVLIGWESGYSEEDAWDDDEWCLGIKIGCPDDFPEYEWCYMPFYKEDGEVWDTSLSFDKNICLGKDDNKILRLCAKDASWINKSIPGIIKGLESGELSTGFDDADEYWCPSEEDF